MHNFGRDDLLSDKERLPAGSPHATRGFSGDGGACRLPESGGRNVMPPALAPRVCRADGPVANGGTVEVLLLALADVSVGILYSIFGLPPYAAPPAYLST